MELIAGEDLSQRIARGAILIDEALPIAKQIADAGVDRPAVENQRSYLHGHSALSRASSRHSGRKGLLKGSHPDPGHGSADLLV